MNLLASLMLALALSSAAAEGAAGAGGTVGALRARLRADDPAALRNLMGDAELAGWLAEANGDVERAAAAARDKAAWRARLGRVSMADCARGFDSDGFAVCLEGLRDRSGRPIVYSVGLPRGNLKQMERQTVYLQVRGSDVGCARRSRGLALEASFWIAGGRLRHLGVPRRCLGCA